MTETQRPASRFLPITTATLVTAALLLITPVVIYQLVPAVDDALVTAWYVIVDLPQWAWTHLFAPVPEFFGSVFA